MDFKQPAEIIGCALRAALLPEEMLQEGRGMRREHCPGQGPHPCPGERLFVHMAGGKPANPMLRSFGIAPSWHIHRKTQSRFSCKPFLFHLRTSSSLKSLALRAMLTHAPVIWGRGNSRFKVGHPGTKQGLSCTWWTGLAHFMCGVALSRFHPHEAIALYFVTLASDYSRARGKRKILPVCDLPLSELRPSVCLALSITVSCLTLCCPLALNWGKTAQIQVQLKRCFMGVTLNAL